MQQVWGKCKYDKKKEVSIHFCTLLHYLVGKLVKKNIFISWRWNSTKLLSMFAQSLWKRHQNCVNVWCKWLFWLTLKNQTLSKFEKMWTEEIDNSKTLYQVKSNYGTFYCIFYLVYFNPLLCLTLVKYESTWGREQNLWNDIRC